MEHQVEEDQTIPAFFSGRTVFLTGATGYVGKAVMEKLLRSCPNIRKIYALVREHKGLKPEERILNTLKSPLFDRLKKESPEQLEKIVTIRGDTGSPLLGISESDLKTIVSEVSVIIHLAATIKFNEPLKIAMAINVGATEQLLKIAKTIPNIAAVVHISTAYANCNRFDVDEKVYEMAQDPLKLLRAIELLDDQIVEAMTPALLDTRPNTYTFTKALAEQVVRQESENIPIAIVRPSIVMNTWKEPFPGFADNMNGGNGLLAAGLKGILKTVYVSPHIRSDVIPLDLVVNLTIAAAWRTATSKEKTLRVYNTCSGLNSMSWFQTMKIAKEFASVYGCTKAINNRGRFFLRESWTMYMIDDVVYHYIPCVLMDVNASLRGRQPKMMNSYKKLRKSLETLQYFMNREWSFRTEASEELLTTLTPTDRLLFNFNVKEIVWRNFFINACYGTQRFILKDEETLVFPPIPEQRLFDATAFDTKYERRKFRKKEEKGI